MVTNVKAQQDKADQKDELYAQFCIMVRSGDSTLEFRNAFVTFEKLRQILINNGETWGGLKLYIREQMLLEGVRS